MKQHHSSRTDERLLSILYETGSWTITGAGGDVIGMAASLREGIEAAARMGGNQRVVALSRRPADDIIVFEGQIERLIAEM